MSSRSKSKANTVGSRDFKPDGFMDSWDPAFLPAKNDLRRSIVQAFGLSTDDDYVYHAIASVTLNQVQVAIDHGNANGMHAWYRDEAGDQLPPPNPAHIEAYLQIFSPSTVTTKALASYSGNAKKGSIRESVAKHLQNNLHLPAPGSGIVLPGKQKSHAMVNPALDFWAWSCHCLEWAGPDAGAVHVKHSHHILPIFYHHFGCVCPTYDALSLMKQLSCRKKSTSAGESSALPVLDVGSGNGYWTLLLRRFGLTAYAIDNALSAWRTTWIPDTILMDAVEFLGSKVLPHAIRTGSPGVGLGGRGAILLLVYPQVSNDFAAKVINAYRGDVIVVAGTQNRNGFTGFIEQTVAEWFLSNRLEFALATQLPLPSFAGKDEALFIFLRQEESKS